MAFIFMFDLRVVGKAFAVATAIVFGGGSLMFGIVVSKLDLQNVRKLLNHPLLFASQGSQIYENSYSSCMVSSFAG